MTAAGLPENQDDAANRRVAIAQQEYEKAYVAAGSIYKDPNRRLNWAFGLRYDAEKKLQAAELFKDSVRDDTEADDLLPPNSPLLRRIRKDERERSETEIRRARDGERIGSFTKAWTRFERSQRRPPRFTEGIDVQTDIATVRIPQKPYAPDLPAGQGARPYQREILDKLSASDGNDLVVAPTGAGKTYIFTRFLKDETAKGKKVAVLAHQNVLISQISDDIQAATGRRPGLVHGDIKDFSQPITVISHGTVVGNPVGTIPGNFDPDIVIVDEAHHAASPGYRRILRRLDADRTLGFTATPNHGNGLPLVGSNAPFDDVICEVTAADLVNQGYLVRPTFVDVTVTDKRGGETRINKARNAPELMAQAVVRARQAGRSHILIFAGPTPDAGLTPTDVVKNITDAIPEGVIPRSEILGTTDPEERRQALANFNRNKAGVLINYATLNEGFDSPKVDAIILGREVGNDGTLAQIIGRGMRRPRENPNAKKDVLVFNFSDATAGELEKAVFLQSQGKKGAPGCDPPALRDPSPPPPPNAAALC